jgi:hypothetical protein
MKIIRGRLDIWSSKDLSSTMDYHECIIDDGVPRNLSELLREFDNQQVVITVERVRKKEAGHTSEPER